MKDKTMLKLLTLPAALLLTVSASQALAQGHGGDKPGKEGKGGGGEHAQGHKDHLGNGGKGNKHKDRGDEDRGDKGENRYQQAERDDDRGRGREYAGSNRERDRDHDQYRAYGLIKGCPPGLAKKNNGCLPPGQAKKAQRARYDFGWGQANDGFVHRYDDGYQYRYDRQGSLLGYLPALGGALSVGNPWPTQYRYEPAPRSQLDYYRLNDSSDYRYADGAIYGVDPKTAMIQQVVALVTGQSAAVGQRLPSGYDVYNVPYAYRDQYPDTANTTYRYNDGAIYQVNPKTQMIMAVIQLLAQKR
ncbi:hypothetical protein [Caulobacter sp. DWR1-3-2b1]|uniref:hypothetical protein n=1 Tax=Caulobacter sp. DWR1-3-2b1 TaxID=2804670 RepID=UPI003CFB41AA